MYFQNFLGLTTFAYLKMIKIVNSFKLFSVMCLRYVTKFASIFKLYITYIVTLGKLVKFEKFVWNLDFSRFALS